MCYYQIIFFEKAEEEYHKVIEHEGLVESYYNLGVLYNKTNQQDKSKMMLEKCLEIKPDFSKARDVIKDINRSPVFLVRSVLKEKDQPSAVATCDVNQDIAIMAGIGIDNGLMDYGDTSAQPKTVDKIT